MRITFTSEIFTSFDSAGRRSPGTVFARIDQYNQDLGKRYTEFRSQRQPFLGWYLMRGVAVTDYWGLVYDQDTRVTPVLLPGFGWQREHLNYAAQKGNLSIEQDLGAYAAMGPVVKSHVGPLEIEVAEPVCLLSWPGALTYGHWITDLVGRMELAQRHRETSMRFLTPGPIQPWMNRFFGLYGIRPDRLMLLDKSVTYRCAELIAPTIMGHMPGGVLPVEFLKPVFDRHRANIAAWLPQSTNKDAVIFLRHTRQTSSTDRELTNVEEIAAMIERSGGIVVDPLKTSMGDLLARFNAATMVIGQDSSALHNVVFAKPVDLLVIETQPRANLMHASIQEIAGGKVSYFKASLHEGGWRADSGLLEAHLNLFRRRAG